MVRQILTGKFIDSNASSPAATLTTAEDADYEAAIILHHNADHSAEIVDASPSSESAADATAPAVLTSDPAGAAAECETKDSQPSEDTEAADQQQLAKMKQAVSPDEDSSDYEDTCILLATTEDSAGDAGGAADSETPETDAECEEGEMELLEEDQGEAGQAGQEDRKSDSVAAGAKAEQESQASATTEEEKKRLKEEEEKQQIKQAKRERKRVKRIAKKVAKRAAKNDALFPKRPNPDEYSYLINVRVENRPKW